MSSILDKYKVFYNDKAIGYYYIYSNHKATYYTEWGCPWDMEDTLKEMGLEKELQETKPLKVFTDLINDANRVPGRRRIIYRKGPLLLERYPMDTGERFTVYRRGARKGTPENSPVSHDAPHYEGPKNTEGRREWASGYAD